jgi:DUF2934 family protein
MSAHSTGHEPEPEDLPLEERIRQRAHELYIERGSESGSEMNDWLQAEEEIMEAEDQKIEDEE